MFKPIIHNLEAGTELFNLCQQYNKLITEKPKAGDLQQKIAAQREWQNACNELLAKITNLTNTQH